MENIPGPGEHVRVASRRVAGEFKLRYEKLRHDNIMEELRFMKKNKITVSPRGVLINVGESITRERKKR